MQHETGSFNAWNIAASTRMLVVFRRTRKAHRGGDVEMIELEPRPHKGQLLLGVVDVVELALLTDALACLGQEPIPIEAGARLIKDFASREQVEGWTDRHKNVCPNRTPIFLQRSSASAQRREAPLRVTLRLILSHELQCKRSSHAEANESNERRNSITNVPHDRGNVDCQAGAVKIPRERHPFAATAQVHPYHMEARPQQLLGEFHHIEGVRPAFQTVHEDSRRSHVASGARESVDVHEDPVPGATLRGDERDFISQPSQPGIVPGEQPEQVGADGLVVGVASKPGRHKGDLVQEESSFCCAARLKSFRFVGREKVLAGRRRAQVYWRRPGGIMRRLQLLVLPALLGALPSLLSAPGSAPPETPDVPAGGVAKDAPPRAETQSVTFVESPVSAGLKRTQAVRLQMSMHVEMRRDGSQARSLSIGNHRDEEVTETVLAVAEGRARSVGVSFLKAMETETRSGVTKEIVLPQSGKAYILHRDAADAVQTRYAVGGEPPPGEQRTARKEAHFLHRDPLRADLVGRTMRIGDPAPFLEKGLVGALNHGGKSSKTMVVRRVSVVLREIQPCGTFRCGHFAIELDLGVKTGVRMDIALRGTLVVQGEGAWPLLLTLQGPLLFERPGQNNEAKGPNIELTGGGSMSVEFKNRFELVSLPETAVSQ